MDKQTISAAFKATSPLYGISPTEERIRRQAALVSTLTPGTKNHRMATELLLILRDSAAAMAQARETVRAARHGGADPSSQIDQLNVISEKW